MIKEAIIAPTATTEVTINARLNQLERGARVDVNCMFLEYVK